MPPWVHEILLRLRAARFSYRNNIRLKFYLGKIATGRQEDEEAGVKTGKGSVRLLFDPIVVSQRGCLLPFDVQYIRNRAGWQAGHEGNTRCDYRLISRLATVL